MDNDNPLTRGTAPPVATAGLVPETAGLLEHYLRRSLAENTWRAYRFDLLDFGRWTGQSQPLPTSATVIARYLTERAADGLSPKTLSHRIAALRLWHRSQGYSDPCEGPMVRSLLRGIRREWAEKSHRAPHQAPVFTRQAVWAMAGLPAASAIQVRDRALFLVGLAGGCRQSELARLRVEHLTPVDGGLSWRVGSHKGDRMGETDAHRMLPDEGGPLNPVAALRRWLEQGAIREGVVFRPINRLDDGNWPMRHKAMNESLRRLAREAGIEDWSRYSIHSLRATLVTQGLSMGIPAAVIAQQTLHRNLQMMNTYYRPRAGTQREGVVQLLNSYGDAPQLSGEPSCPPEPE